MIAYHRRIAENTLAIVSEYMETLFSDRGIVRDRHDLRLYRNTFQRLGDRQRSGDRQGSSAIIWKHFSAIGGSSAIVSDSKFHCFQRSGDREALHSKRTSFSFYIRYRINQPIGLGIVLNRQYIGQAFVRPKHKSMSLLYDT